MTGRPAPPRPARPPGTRLHLDRLGAAAARDLEPELVATYAEVYADKLGTPFFGVERFRERFAAHTARDGYTLVTARAAPVGDADPELVGYAYGVPLAADTRWWSGLVAPLPAEATREDGGRTFALNEIMVRRPWRRRGVGRLLHDALLSARTEGRAALLVDPTNTPARSAYLAWGWRWVGRVQPFPDAPVYDAMLCEAFPPGRPGKGGARPELAPYRVREN